MWASIRAFLWRLTNLFHERRAYGSLDQEIEFHLKMEIEENRRQGMSTDEARRHALIALGGIGQIKEVYRETGSGRWLESLIQDVRYASRMFRRDRGLTAVVIVTLALAIGGNAAIFSFVDGFMLRALPYSAADRIVWMTEKPPGGGRYPISALNYLDWIKQNTAFEYMAAAGWSDLMLTGIPEPLQLRASQVSSHYFDIFGINPMLGRTFSSDEDQAGKGNVVVLSHVLWKTQFGADKSIINRKIILDGEPYLVIGVMPPVGIFNEFVQIWRPLVFGSETAKREYRRLGAFGLLKRGVTVERAQAEMNTIGERLAGEYPESNKGWGVGVVLYSEAMVGLRTRRVLLILISASGMVLLIGCANIANLLMARASSREHEVALRVSLGAGRRRLIRQFLTESILLSACGGIFGIGVGYAGMAALRANSQFMAMPPEVIIVMNVRVLLFALIISVLTGMLFGLAPALQSSCLASVAIIKEGAPGGTAGRRRSLFRRVLVVAEIAVAFILLTGAGLLLHSLYRVMHVDPGFDSANVLTARVPISPRQFPDPVRMNAYLREIMLHVEGVPGVKEAALTTAPPLEGWADERPYHIDGRPPKDRANQPRCPFKVVSPSYFHTLGILLIQGRGLVDKDVRGTLPVTVINQSMAQREFPNENPIGRCIITQVIPPSETPPGSEIPWIIVGVIKDEKTDSLQDERNWGMYVSNEQNPVYGVTLVVRTATDPLRFEQSIRNAVHEVNKDQPLAEVKTLEQIKSRSSLPSQVLAELLGIFAAVAMLLAAVGIYGISSYSVAQRAREIGIRAALGANARDLLRTILQGSLALTVIGLTLGGFGAFGIVRLMQNLLFEIRARDPVTFFAVTAVLGGVALLASFIPARRIIKADPAATLRCE
jgi:putative ABC transport system permease protein